MKISCKKLWVMLIQRDITKVQLRTDVGISAGTVSKFNKGEEVVLSVLLRICDYLNCDIGDVCEAVCVKRLSFVLYIFYATRQMEKIFGCTALFCSGSICVQNQLFKRIPAKPAAFSFCGAYVR